MRTINNYMDMNKLQSQVAEIYKDVRDNFIDDDNEDFLTTEIDDDFIDEFAFDTAERINNEMCEYLNSNYHNLPDRLNNIDYDYTEHITGVYSHKRDLVNAMISRLNAGENSEQANKDRDYLLDWFWDTYGSYGLRYNFGDYLNERLYEYETNMNN